ncbi:MAG: DedA family protein [Planctomycetales bacterium]|jgi:membrane-associated protein|nr:DedA family protein [Planctomycetales bacterium]
MEMIVQCGISLAELFWWSFDLLFHLDDELKKIVADYGVSSHWILFAVVFCETGLIVTPFLPGDSLLFAAGAFAGAGSLRLDWLLPMLIVAAIVGDTVNYLVGRWIGTRAFNGSVPFMRQEHLEKTQRFFDCYGGKTIILARFVPIVRTFAPFVAGIGGMNYRRFAIYNVVGGIGWVLIFTMLGYYFGTLSVVEKNFELVMVAIVGVSLLPPIWEWIQHRRVRQPLVNADLSGR